MVKWKHRLEVRDLWQAYKKKEIDIAQLAKKVADRIRELRCYEQDKELEDIALNFEACSNDVEEFDDCLCELYDWADVDKRCWIALQ